MLPFVLILVLAKSIYITQESHSSSPFVFALAVLRADLFVPAAVAALTALALSARPRWLQIACPVTAAAIALIYFFDAATLALFHQRLWLGDVVRYVPDFAVWRLFWPEVVFCAVVAAAALFALVRRLRMPLARRSGLVWGTAALALIFTVAAFPPPPAATERYAFGRGSHRLAAPARDIANSCALDCDAIRQLEVAAAPPEDRNVIIVVVESLGSEISKALSGEFDMVPRFDALLRRGTHFPRYFATGENSHNAFLALIGGFAPIPVLETNSRGEEMFDRIGEFPGPLRGLAAKGYQTHLLSGYRWFNSPTIRWAGQAGFDTIDTPENNAALEVRGRLVAVEDAQLYQYAAKVSGDWTARSRHLMFVFTGGTHGARRSAELWREADTQIDHFVNLLDAQGYFRTGWLLITGDHRAPVPLTESMERQFQLTAPARVPLVAIGPEFPANQSDDRLLSHADLLRRLGALADRGAPLSDVAIFVDYSAGEVAPFRLLESRVDGTVAVARAVATPRQVNWLSSEVGVPNGWPPMARQREILGCLAHGHGSARWCRR